MWSVESEAESLKKTERRSGKCEMYWVVGNFASSTLATSPNTAPATQHGRKEAHPTLAAVRFIHLRQQDKNHLRQ